MALEFSQNLTKSEFFEKYSRNACQDKSHVWYFTSGFDKNSRILESYSICKNSFYRSQIQLEGTKSFISKELTKIELINAITGNYKLGPNLIRVTLKLVADVEDEMDSWQLLDVGDGFGHFGHQHQLYFYISVEHQH